MSEVYAWDITAGNNNDPSPDGWPENMNRTGVNNSARENMAAVRRWYAAPEWLQLFSGYTVTKDDWHTVRIAGVDASAAGIVGRRVRLSGGGTVYGTIVSATYSSPDTTFVIDVDPGLGNDELASGINLTFADADPDTIAAASGSPFSSLVADDRVRVELSASNAGSYRVATVAAALLTLEASETLTAESAVDAKIYHEHGIVPDSTNSMLFALSPLIKDAAYRSVGSGSGDLPSMAHLGTHAAKKEGAGGGIDADKVDGKHYLDILSESALIANMAINSEFRRWQEGASFASINDNTYCADQWKVLSDGNAAVTVARTTTLSELPPTAYAGIKITQITLDKDWALYQLFAATRSAAARGQNVSLSFQARLASGDTSPSSLRFGIIEWTGAADTPDADIIASWPVAGADPVFTTPGSCEILGATSQVLSAGSVVECKTEAVAVGSGMTNLGLLIWSDDDTIAATDELVISQIKVEVGDLATTYRHDSQQQLEDETHRFFAKTFPETTTPANLATTYEGAIIAQGAGDGLAGNCRAMWAFPERMHSAPTVTAYSPGTAAPGGGTHWWNIGDGAQETELIQYECDRSVEVVVNSAFATYKEMAIQLTADARFF
ncbi:MAG: hypothetical protein V3W32_05865 [Gemmatimonadota bacterium]